jgi:hypothetical protein
MTEDTRVSQLIEAVAGMKLNLLFSILFFPIKNSQSHFAVPISIQ